MSNARVAMLRTRYKSQSFEKTTIHLGPMNALRAGHRLLLGQTETLQGYSRQRITDRCFSACTPKVGSKARSESKQRARASIAASNEVGMT